RDLRVRLGDDVRRDTLCPCPRPQEWHTERARVPDAVALPIPQDIIKHGLSKRVRLVLRALDHGPRPRRGHQALRYGIKLEYALWGKEKDLVPEAAQGGHRVGVDGVVAHDGPLQGAHDVHKPLQAPALVVSGDALVMIVDLHMRSSRGV